MDPFGCEFPSDARALDAATEWARSGAMALTGRAEGPPVVAPAALAVAAQRAAEAFCRLARSAGATLSLDGPALLGERAAIAGLVRKGRVAAGGGSRLMRSADGWIAVSLARPDDFAAIPAWLETAIPEPAVAWSQVASRARESATQTLVDRARLLGLAVADAAVPVHTPRPWLHVAARGGASERRPSDRPLVVDLSSLWAGPLCAQLLLLAGARVVKVESVARPDGARFGPAAFFDLLNAGKQSVALDFTTRVGCDTLQRLLRRADIVIESARPRALRQLGIDAESLVATRPGLTWVSITGYGRSEPEADWVAFGDDAAAAAGLAAVAGRGDDGPLFCGDAIADPLAGLHAAVAALATWQAGGGALLDVSLAGVASHAITRAPEPMTASGAAVAPPRARAQRGRACPLGADTITVLRDLAIG
jgi:crotonobetainyl-CoA:carnitine CoA-transferase CaiB-like acyl-CoA transferase